MSRPRELTQGNRVLAAIVAAEENIQCALATGRTTVDGLVDLDRTLDMSIVEYVKFQEYKTLATAQGILSAEEANTVYDLLGESLSTFNDQPLAVKVALTGLFEQLLKRRVQTISKKRRNR